jgi:enoyl-CoA hydratase/carnithine racemase
LIKELNHATVAIDGDKQHGAIVITGNEKAFAAGADIKEMKDREFPDVYTSQMLGGTKCVADVRLGAHHAHQETHYCCS